MLDDHAVEHGLDRLSIFGRQLTDGLELQLEFVIRPAFLGIQDRCIAGDGECKRKFADDFERGLCGAALVALNLGQMHALNLGQMHADQIQKTRTPTIWNAEMRDSIRSPESLRY